MPGKPNIVALQKARLELTKALQQLNTEVKKLETQVKSADPGVATSIKKTRATLKQLNADLVEKLDEALNESNAPKAQAAYGAVVQSFKRIAKQVVSDPALTAIKENSLGVKIAGVDAVRNALGSLGRTLQ